MSIQDVIRDQVTSNDVVLYMKGSPQFPQCGFSSAAVQIRFAQAVCPLAYQAFEEHVLHGRNFARSEIELLRSALDRDKLVAALEASGMRASRRREFLDKLGLAG